jgi:RNA polymerase sigma-70 factor (ECF subfamily)
VTASVRTKSPPDVATDGRFLMLKRIERTAPVVRLAFNWLDERSEGARQTPVGTRTAGARPSVATKREAAVFRDQARMKEWELTLTEREGEPAASARSEGFLTFEEAFAQHHRLVYRYACALTRDSALAEDAAQEVFLRLHRQRIAADILRPWLIRVTANVARNLLRTRHRAMARDNAFAVDALQRHESRLPDEELGRESDIRKAKETLGKIDEPQRSCLLLRHEGLSYREIAAALGLKESHVGSLIARGRLKFMKLYGKPGKDQ